MSDGFEENAEFFTLTYEAEKSVSHNLAFVRIAPLLWLRAGARGERIEKNTGYTDLMVDGAPSPHQSDTTLRWLIDRLRS